MPATAERVGDMLCGVGESPVWRASDQTFTWTDIPNKTLWRWSPVSGEFSLWSLPQMAGCIAMRGAGWLLAMEDGVYTCDALLPDHAGLACWPASRTRLPTCASTTAAATDKAASWPARW
jgi:sugar lactone lactonase YvrE